MSSDTGQALRYGTPAGRWVLVAAVLGSGIAAIDATVVSIALPRIGRDFHTGVADLQWVVTAYTLTLAAFLLLGGSLGDHFGRRRVFTIGVAWFAIASAGCAVAPSALTLIAARALQGVGAALLTPGSLAILQASFAPEDRARAIGAWSGFGGLATAAGPLVGGYLISASSWRLVFFINLPLAAVVLWLTTRHVPETHDPSATGAIDVEGAAVAVVGLSGVTYALIEGPVSGWSSPAIVAMAVVGVVALLAFIRIEQRSASPMLPLGVFANRQFSAANAVTFVVYGALSGGLFLLPVELQVADGYSPTASGVSLLPITVIMLLFSARSGRLAARIGPRLQMSAGPLVVGAGLALLSRVTTGSDYFTYVLPGVLVFGTGLAITVAPLTATAMAAAPAEHAGLASAVNNDVARAAGLLAVAILPVAAGITGSSYLHPAELSSGFRTAVLIAAAMCWVGGLLAAATIRNGERLSERHTDCVQCQVDAPQMFPAER
jgi:EmrB/QacA subfamily drug resistance transporter